jgi:hypothetical protein
MRNKDSPDLVLLAAGIALALAAPFAAWQAVPDGPGAVLVSGLPPFAAGVIFCWLALPPSGRHRRLWGGARAPATR